MYSGSVAFTGTQSAGPAAAAARSQSTSRPSTRVAAAWGRCRMTHACGFWLQQRVWVAAAIANVPIYRVEAGVEHAVGEPAVEGGIRFVQHDSRLLIPVDPLDSRAPESFRVGEALLERFRVSAHNCLPSLLFRLLPVQSARCLTLCQGAERQDLVAIACLTHLGEGQIEGECRHHQAEPPAELDEPGRRRRARGRRALN